MMRTIRRDGNMRFYCYFSAASMHVSPRGISFSDISSFTKRVLCLEKSRKLFVFVSKFSLDKKPFLLRNCAISRAEPWASDAICVVINILQPDVLLFYLNAIVSQQARDRKCLNMNQKSFPFRRERERAKGARGKVTRHLFTWFGGLKVAFKRTVSCAMRADPHPFTLNLSLRDHFSSFYFHLAIFPFKKVIKRKFQFSVLCERKFFKLNKESITDQSVKKREDDKWALSCPSPPATRNVVKCREKSLRAKAKSEINQRGKDLNNAWIVFVRV